MGQWVTLSSAETKVLDFSLKPNLNPVSYTHLTLPTNREV